MSNIFRKKKPKKEKEEKRISIEKDEAQAWNDLKDDFPELGPTRIEVTNKPKEPGSQKLLTFDFTDAKAAENLKSMKRQARFLGFNKGEFGKVTSGAKAAHNAVLKFEAGKGTPEQALADLETLRKAAEAWLEADEDRGVGDKKRRQKEMMCNDQIRRANAGINQIKNRDTLNNPATQKRFAELDKAYQLSVQNPEDLGLAEEYRMQDAALLVELCGTKQPPGGTSDVHLIKGIDGSIAYAFKPMEGEAAQMGTPEGSGAVREVLMSNMCGMINQACGIDFGWPKTSMATLHVGGKNKTGALVDGLKGDVFGTEAPKQRKDEPEADFKKRQVKFAAEKKRACEEIVPALPAAAVQKIILCNLAMGNYDIKWDNVMIESTPTGYSAKPFDAGTAVLDPITFSRQCATGAGMGANGVMNNPGETMTVDQNQQEYGATKAPIDPELAAKFQLLDDKTLAVMEQKLQQEIVRMQKTTQMDFAELGLDPATAFVVTKELMAGTRDLLATKGLTTQTLVTEYQSKVINPLVAKTKDTWTRAWEADTIKQYNAIKNRYPEVADVGADKAADMYDKVVDAEQQKFLKELVHMVGPGGLAGIKAQWPDILWPSNTMQGALTAFISRRKRALTEELEKNAALVEKVLKSKPEEVEAEVKAYLQSGGVNYAPEDLADILRLKKVWMKKTVEMQDSRLRMARRGLAKIEKAKAIATAKRKLGAKADTDAGKKEVEQAADAAYQEAQKAFPKLEALIAELGTYAGEPIDYAAFFPLSGQIGGLLRDIIGAQA